MFQENCELESHLRLGYRPINCYSELALDGRSILHTCITLLNFLFRFTRKVSLCSLFSSRSWPHSYFKQIKFTEKPWDSPKLLSYQKKIMNLNKVMIRIQILISLFLNRTFPLPVMIRKTLHFQSFLAWLAWHNWKFFLVNVSQWRAHFKNQDFCSEK